MWDKLCPIFSLSFFKIQICRITKSANHFLCYLIVDFVLENLSTY